jgi:hypothetical protein
MRDGELYSKFEALQHRSAMAYRQMVFLDTRMQAMEAVFMTAAWFDLIFKRQRLLAAVDTLHIKLMQQHDDERKMQVQAKPKITLVNANGVIH